MDGIFLVYGQKEKNFAWVKIQKKKRKISYLVVIYTHPSINLYIITITRGDFFNSSRDVGQTSVRTKRYEIIHGLIVHVGRSHTHCDCHLSLARSFLGVRSLSCSRGPGEKLFYIKYTYINSLPIFVDTIST